MLVQDSPSPEQKHQSCPALAPAWVWLASVWLDGTSGQVGIWPPLLGRKQLWLLSLPRPWGLSGPTLKRNKHKPFLFVQL